jgi:hypothetical protein
MADGMTISLIFSKTMGEETTKGPYSSVRFEGDRILDGASGGLIATHLPHGWRVDGDDYLRLDATAPVSVVWEGYAGAPSTTGHFSSINGVAYIDRRILGFMDRERNDWYLVREGRHQSAFTVQPA